MTAGVGGGCWAQADSGEVAGAGGRADVAGEREAQFLSTMELAVATLKAKFLGKVQHRG